MSTLLDLPEVHSRVVRWTVDEYEQLAEQGLIPRQAELFRGLIIEKMPKSPLHRSLSKRLYDLFQKALPPGFVVFQEAPLRFADSEPEPDVSIVRGEEQQFREHHPETAALAVEVAVSSASLDRANAPIYAEAGIPEYWIVLGRERLVEVYRLNPDGTYGKPRRVGLGETLACAAVPGLALRVEDFFA
jgi:Uma2 family endonuclease